MIYRDRMDITLEARKAMHDLLDKVLDIHNDRREYIYMAVSNADSVTSLCISEKGEGGHQFFTYADLQDVKQTRSLIKKIGVKEDEHDKSERKIGNIQGTDYKGRGDKD